VHRVPSEPVVMPRLTRSSCRGALIRFTVLVALAFGSSGTLAAQQARTPATVTYIAGSDVYLGIGTDQGIGANDTLVVFASAEGDPIGRFVVVSATSTRAVVGFLGTPFPVTRGTTLYVTVASASHVPLTTAAPVGPPARQPAGPPEPGPSIHGRLGIQADAFESTTLWQSNQVESVKRRFATPSVSLRAVVADIPGGFSFTTNLSGVYRYSDPDLIDPTATVHLYEASISKTFTGAPVTIQAGRFNNRYSNFSGLWDGLLLHVGGRGLGVGVAAGYEPTLGDAGFSTMFPKGSAFVTYDAGTGPVRYATSLSVTQVRPTTNLLDHSFAGWSQYLRVGRFRLGNDIQVDRNPESARWIISRLNANASIPLVPGLEVHGRISMFQPYQIWLTSNFMPFRRDQANVGLFLFGRAGSAGADFTVSRLEGGTNSYAYSASVSLVRTPVFGLDWSASGSYSTQTGFKTLFATAGVSRSVGRALARASYQLYRSSELSVTSVSHEVDAGFSFPLAGTLSATLQGRIQRGANLRTNGLFVGFWTSF
jgi:hypothetical protein